MLVYLNLICEKFSNNSIEVNIEISHNCSNTVCTQPHVPMCPCALLICAFYNFVPGATASVALSTLCPCYHCLFQVCFYSYKIKCCIVCGINRIFHYSDRFCTCTSVETEMTHLLLFWSHWLTLRSYRIYPVLFNTTFLWSHGCCLICWQISFPFFYSMKCKVYSSSVLNFT